MDTESGRDAKIPPKTECISHMNAKKKRGRLRFQKPKVTSRYLPWSLCWKYVKSHIKWNPTKFWVDCYPYWVCLTNCSISSVVPTSWNNKETPASYSGSQQFEKKIQAALHRGALYRQIDKNADALTKWDKCLFLNDELIHAIHVKNSETSVSTERGIRKMAGIIARNSMLVCQYQRVTCRPSRAWRPLALGKGLNGMTDGFIAAK